MGAGADGIPFLERSGFGLRGRVADVRARAPIESVVRLLDNGVLPASPDARAAGLHAALRATATDLGDPGPEPLYGHGLVKLDPDLLFADDLEAGDTAAWTASAP